MQTRELFSQFSPFAFGMFYLIVIAAIAAFVAGLARHLLRYRRGRPAGVPVDWRGGLRRMLDDVVTHRTLSRRDPYAGTAHKLIFFGFATLFIGTSTITLEYDIVKPLTGLTFWKGWFYLGFSLVMDIAGLMLIAGLVMMIARRAWFGLAKLDYVRRYRGDTAPLPRATAWKIEDWIFLVTLLLIALDAILGRAHQALLIVGPVVLAMAFISHEKTRYLGDPLYPADILYARQILDLLPLLARERPWTMAAVVAGAIGGIALFVTALVLWRRKKPLAWRGRLLRLVVALPVLASFASMMDYSTFSWMRDRLRIVPMMWDQKENYSHNGFAAAFILNVPMADVAKPKGYSKKAIQSIAAGPAVSVPADAPDIIIVMNES
ncbi:MAG: hypothetical protein J0H80_20270, partial [Rhizobiales bacterium]|nr:hypothetical protein [Hyphomicrobiales bacterium]